MWDVKRRTWESGSGVVVRGPWSVVRKDIESFADGPRVFGSLIPDPSIPDPDCYPPAMAPTTRKGSAPATTGSGKGVSGGSCERSCSQAKYRTKGRRRLVT